MTLYHALELMVVAAVVGSAAAYVARRFTARRAAPGAASDAACGGCKDGCAVKDPRAS
jgi:hypothetical protein